MCLAVPMKVIEIDGNTARVELSGIERQVRCDFLEDVSPGCYVLVHAGMAIEKVSEEDANETLRLIRMIADDEVC
jgi:hydrogenase expression/formation protein HypC